MAIMRRSVSDSDKSQLLRPRDMEITVVFLAFAGLLCLAFYNLQSLPQFYRFSDLQAEDMRILEKVLREAATEDKTVIVTTLNRAWAEPNSIFDMFLESFRIGEGTKSLLRHVVVACLDEEAYSRCLVIHPGRCYFLRTAGIDFSGEKKFMTPDYLKMMWRRIEFLGSLLKLGYNFIFTDADIVWLRNPFPHLYKDIDFQIACDRFRGNVTDINNDVNGGFTFVQSNQRSIDFYDYWFTSRLRFPKHHDQDVFNKIKNSSYITEIGLKMRFLDTIYFGGFCARKRDMKKMCTIHANCCYGQQNKVKDLRQVLVDWRNYMSSNGQMLTWQRPVNCFESMRLRALKYNTSFYIDAQNFYNTTI